MNERTLDRMIAPDDEKKLDLSIRDAPRDAPSVGIFDAPFRCYIINEQWEAHIAGAISALAEWRAWIDAEDDRADAVQEVLKLLSGEENCATMIAFRQETACELEYSTDGGETWTPFADLSACITESPEIASLGASVGDVSDRVNDLEDELDEAPPDGNIYDPDPEIETDPACGSAEYIYNQVLGLIQDIESLPDDYANPLQALQALLATPVNFAFGILKTLILWIFGLPASLLTFYESNARAIIDYLYCNGFDKSAFADFLDSIAEGLGEYARCVAPSTWDRWISIGAISPSEDCGCGTWQEIIETNSVSGDPFTVVVGTTQTTRVISAVLGTGRGLQCDISFATTFVDALSIQYRFDSVANHKLVRAEAFSGAVLVASSEFFSTRTTLGWDSIGLASGTYDKIRITLQASLFATTGFAELDAVDLAGDGNNPF